jgi:hypothetical protein
VQAFIIARNVSAKNEMPFFPVAEKILFPDEWTRRAAPGDTMSFYIVREPVHE